MSETNSEVYTPEQPASAETLPPQDYVDNSIELTESLNGFNNQSTAPEAQSSDLVSGATASDLPEVTDQERIEKVKYSPEQENNIEIMDGLLEEYPHAFIERSTNDGKKYLTLKTIDNYRRLVKFNFNNMDGEDTIGVIECENQTLIFSYRGITQVYKNVEDYDLTPVLNTESTDYSDDKDVIRLYKKTYSDEDPSIGEPLEIGVVRHLDYDSNNIDLEELKSVLTDTEKAHEKD